MNNLRNNTTQRNNKQQQKLQAENHQGWLTPHSPRDVDVVLVPSFINKSLKKS